MSKAHKYARYSTKKGRTSSKRQMIFRKARTFQMKGLLFIENLDFAQEKIELNIQTPKEDLVLPLNSQNC
jgi:hypothetical protein